METAATRGLDAPAVALEVDTTATVTCEIVAPAVDVVILVSGIDGPPLDVAFVSAESTAADDVDVDSKAGVGPRRMGFAFIPSSEEDRTGAEAPPFFSLESLPCCSWVARRGRETSAATAFLEIATSAINEVLCV